MVSRRSFLGASASGALVAITGCVDSIPLIGSSGGGPSGPAESTESFLAEPGLESAVDVVPTPTGASAEIEAYDGSIADHAGDLAIDDDLSNYGTWDVAPADGADAIESNDHTMSASYRTGWQADGADGGQPRIGRATGWIGHLRADYNRAAFESALELSDSPAESTNGYDLYTEGDAVGFGLADDAIIAARILTLHVPGETVDESDRSAGTRAMLERGVSRSTGIESPPEWVQTVVDAVSPAHNIVTYRHETPDGEEESVSAGSLHVDGTETTVALAGGAPDASRFHRSNWTDEAAERDILAQVRSLTDQSRQDLNSIRELLVEPPTVEVSETLGVVSAVIPSAEVTHPAIS